MVLVPSLSGMAGGSMHWTVLLAKVITLSVKNGENPVIIIERTRIIYTGLYTNLHCAYGASLAAKLLTY